MKATIPSQQSPVKNNQPLLPRRYLSPSWSLCIDIGGQHAGAVSGTMNMAGNLGSAMVGLVFPYLILAYGPKGFFWVGAALNLAAIGLWLLASPERKLEDAA